MYIKPICAPAVWLLLLWYHQQSPVLLLQFLDQQVWQHFQPKFCPQCSDHSHQEGQICTCKQRQGHNKGDIDIPDKSFFVQEAPMAGLTLQTGAQGLPSHRIFNVGLHVLFIYPAVLAHLCAGSITGEDVVGTPAITEVASEKMGGTNSTLYL